MSDNRLYIVTGASGHLGNTIVEKLLKKNLNVRILLLPGEHTTFKKNVETIYGDVCKKETLLPLFYNNKNLDLYIIHCAGIVSIATKFNQKVYDVNVGGTKNIADLCLKYKVKRLIYVSSVHAITEKTKGETIKEISNFEPDKLTGLYAKTKALASNYVLGKVKEGLNACIVHPSGICGPSITNIGHVTKIVIDYCNNKLNVGTKGGYDFVDVRDVADGIISAVDNGKNGECYILSNQYYSVKQILYMLHDLTGLKKIRIYLPFWFVRIFARIAETYYKILKETPLFTPYSIYTLESNSKFSHEKASRELSFKTRDMNISLRDTIIHLAKRKMINVKLK